MKWIGQHIWDFISRFRSDVYLENVTESAQDHVVGIDSDGKLYKQDVSTGDITSVTAGTGLDGGGTSGDVTLSVDVSDFMTNGVDNYVLTATGADAMNAEQSLKYDPPRLTIGINTDSMPELAMANDVNTLLMGVSNATNGGIIGTADGDVFINSSGNHNVCIGQNNQTNLKIDTDGDVVIPNNLDVTGAITGNVTGNASTATSLATARAINGVDFDGTAPITITAAGSTLSDTVTVAKGGTGATTLTSNALLTGNGTSAIQAESNLTYASGIFELSSTAVSRPVVIVKSTGGVAHIGGSLDFITDEGDAGAPGDVLGRVRFIGDNADQDTPQQTYAQIQGKVDVATDGEESGILELQVANHDDDLETGLTLTGGSQDSEIDATIGLGSSSLTTIAGDLQVTGNDIKDSGGNTCVTMDGSGSVTSVAGVTLMKQTKVTLSESDCNSLNSTAVTLVAAAGANQIIVPVSVVLLITRDGSTAQSNSSCDLFISWGGQTSLGKEIGYVRRFMYNESGSRTFVFNPAGGYGVEAGQNATAGENVALTIKVDSAVTSGSIDSIVAYTTYYVIDNS